MEDARNILAKSKRRKIIRLRDEDFKPFIPHGILPFLGLLVLFIYALSIFSTATVQATARSEGKAALAAMGADWADLSVSGQYATLEGVAPSSAAKRAAEDAVRKATNRTPVFGIRARPIMDVNNKLTVASAPTAPSVTTADAPSRHDFSYALSSTVLELNGDVPDQATRQTVVDAADARIAPPRITAIRDRLRVTGRTAAPGYTDAALRGVNTLSRCNSGTANLTDNVFALNCEAEASAIAEIEALGNAPFSLGRIGRVDAYARAEVDACNQTFLDLLSSTRVEFATNSAVINASSFGLLDRVAEAARTCPGTLSIDGHTDSSGRATENNRLSLRRAEAVRRALIDRNISASRLRAEGFGANRPIADNSTSEGRARNRRIEIKVSRGGN